jgi:D-alanyl-D-alanine carboxypeptidase
MTRTHFQSIFFAVVLLMLVFFGRHTGEKTLSISETQRSPSERAHAETILSQSKNNESTRMSLVPKETASALSSLVDLAPVSPVIETIPPPLPPPPEQTQSHMLVQATPEAHRHMALSPETLAVAALVKEMGSSFALFEKEAGKSWPIASLTKLMTALIARERILAETRIIFTPEDIATEGESGGFNAGDIFTSEDLVKAMLVVSSNDAADALARFYGRDNFIELMRAKAAEIGMPSTTFSDATGLSSGNRSTADDFEKLAAYIMAHRPEIFSVSASPSVIITNLVTHTSRELTSINQFAGRADFVGGKTGYTAEANGNLLSIFRAQGRNFVIIVFGTSDRFLETEKLYGWFHSRL